MVLWISAIRRCSVSAPGRPLHSLIEVSSTAADEGVGGNSEVVLLRLARHNVLNVSSWRNPEVEIKLLAFLKMNRACAECRAREQLK